MKNPLDYEEVEVRGHLTLQAIARMAESICKRFKSSIRLCSEIPHRRRETLR